MYRIKIISIFLAGVMVLNSAVYAVEYCKKSCLRLPLSGGDRERFREGGMASVDEFVERLKKGDIEFVARHISDEPYQNWMKKLVKRLEGLDQKRVGEIYSELVILGDKLVEEGCNIESLRLMIFISDIIEGLKYTTPFQNKMRGAIEIELSNYLESIHGSESSFLNWLSEASFEKLQKIAELFLKDDDIRQEAWAIGNFSFEHMPNFNRQIQAILQESERRESSKRQEIDERTKKEELEPEIIGEAIIKDVEKIIWSLKDLDGDEKNMAYNMIYKLWKERKIHIERWGREQNDDGIRGLAYLTVGYGEEMVEEYLQFCKTREYRAIFPQICGVYYKLKNKGLIEKKPPKFKLFMLRMLYRVKIDAVLALMEAVINNNNIDWDAIGEYLWSIVREPEMHFEFEKLVVDLFGVGVFRKELGYTTLHKDYMSKNIAYYTTFIELLDKFLRMDKTYPYFNLFKFRHNLGCWMLGIGTDKVKEFFRKFESLDSVKEWSNRLSQELCNVKGLENIGLRIRELGEFLEGDRRMIEEERIIRAIIDALKEQAEDSSGLHKNLATNPASVSI